MQLARTPRRSRLVSRVALVALAAAIVPGVGGIAAADPLDDADATVEALREEADQASNEYFDALARAARLDDTIEGLERDLPELVRQRRLLRARTQRRAVAAYMRSGRQLGILIDSSDALTATRRRELLAQLNERDAALVSELTDTTRRIQQRRKRLESARTEQTRAVTELDRRGRDIDAKLQAALDRRNELHAEAEAAAAVEAAAATTTVPTTVPLEPAPAEVTTTTAPVEIPTTPPRRYKPTPGTHPRHDDPFLTCTRARESSGNYAAVNPEGPYLGAYQFLQSTWNSGANHAGRLELVGVPPNTASAYDQDDIAWVIYQWRGNAPWGDSC
jgi:Transglycosylase-like domain